MQWVTMMICTVFWIFFFFFFQAEDGIRDKLVTGVQTCALPISARRDRRPGGVVARPAGTVGAGAAQRGAVTWPGERASPGSPFSFGSSRARGARSAQIGRAHV